MRTFAHDSYFRAVARDVVVEAVLRPFSKSRQQFRGEPDIMREYDHLPCLTQQHHPVDDFSHTLVVQAVDWIVENDGSRGLQRSFGEKVGKRDDFLLSFREN